MHPNRTRPRAVISMLLASLAVLVGTLVTGLGSAAEAAPDRKPEHHARYDVKRLDATDYLFFGTVSSYPDGTLTVLRKRDGAKRFESWKKVPIHHSGKFSTRLRGSNGDCFRMRIPGADGYRTTTEDLGCIVPR